MDKWIGLLCAGLMCVSSLHADYCEGGTSGEGYSEYSDNEDYYYCNTGGYGYEDCCRASCLAPAIALGTIALVAIIAVAVQNSTSGHNHCDCN